MEASKRRYTVCLERRNRFLQIEEKGLMFLLLDYENAVLNLQVILAFFEADGG